MNVISPKDSAIQKLLPILIILLVAAAFANRADVVNHLLGRGTAVDALDRQGRTALMGAASSGMRSR